MIANRSEAPVPAAHLPDLVGGLVDAGARVLTMVGTDDRLYGRGFGLHLALLHGGETIRIEAALPPDDPRYPSITPRVPALHWDEREMRDMLGVVPVGHPDPRPLVLRDGWPAGLYPLRKDFDPAQAPPFPLVDSFAARVVEGDDVDQVPVGPIHAGIIEPGHFRFSAVGETILHLDAQLFYTHRGIEKAAEGRDLVGGLAVAERACAACAISHATAFAEAAEDALGLEPPRAALWSRVLLLELERLYNHIGDSANMCAGGGLTIGTMRGAALKEEMQRSLERLTGHRFGRNAIAVGGLRRELSADELRALPTALRAWRREARQFRDLVLGSDGFVDRMRGTGVLRADLVRAFGGVGVLARASGIDADIRRDRPGAIYGELAVRVPLNASGDAEARFRQRLDEAAVSFELAEALLEERPGGPIAIGDLRAEAGTGLGVVESPRGQNVHWLRLTPDGRVDRLRIRSASFPNWPLVPMSVPGNLVPDFPMINKSFELCYACLDR